MNGDSVKTAIKADTSVIADATITTVIQSKERILSTQEKEL